MAQSEPIETEQPEADARAAELEGLLRSESEAGIRALFRSGALIDLFPDGEPEPDPLEY